MNTISSIILFGITLLLLIRYRPREEVSIEIAVLCGLLAVITPLAPGNTWFLQAVSISTKALALLCCYLQLRREHRRRRAAARARAGSRQTGAGKDTHLPAA